jgi:hypothetical protein
MLEKIFSLKNIRVHLEYPLYLGVVVTVLGFITSYLLFRQVPQVIGISTILFTVMLSIPLMSKLFLYQERKEVRIKHHFFRKHKVIIDFFIYYFIGVFITLFVLSLFVPNLVFSQSQLYGTPSRVQLAVENKYQNLPPPPSPPLVEEIKGVFLNNLYVMLVSFVLSLFYGAGAIFLIVLNASIFASSLVDVIRVKIPVGLGFAGTYAFVGCNLGIMLFHGIPEVGAYLIAAIAGGVLSTAISREKFMSKRFRHFIKEALYMLILATLIVLLAAIMEMGISKKLFVSGACLSSSLFLLLFLGGIAFAIIIGEYFRRRYW